MTVLMAFDWSFVAKLLGICASMLIYLWTCNQLLKLIQRAHFGIIIHFQMSEITDMNRYVLVIFVLDVMFVAHCVLIFFSVYGLVKKKCFLNVKM